MRTGDAQRSFLNDPASFANSMQSRVPRHSDGFVLKQLTAIGSKHCTNKWSVNAQIKNRDNNDTRSYSFEGTKQSDGTEPWTNNPVLKAVAASEGAILNQLYLAIDGQQAFSIERQPNVPFDSLSLSFSSGDSTSNDPANMARRVTAATDAIRLLSTERLGKPINAVLGDELGTFVQSRDATLARLEELLARFTQDLAQYRRDTDDRLKKGEEELAQRRKEDEAHINMVLAQKETALNAREADLKKRIAEIDDRDSLHARRELRKSIIEKLEARNKEFRLTQGTRRLRWPVAVILALAALVFGGLLAQAVIVSTKLFAEAKEWTVEMTYMVVKQSILTAGFLSVVWYAVRWYNEWFREHADEEFRSKAMVLDIERASWVVETATDWRRATNGDIPTALIERLTQDLFVSRKSIPAPTPDVSAALLGASSKVRLKLGDQAEVELDRKGAKRLQESLGKSA